MRRPLPFVAAILTAGCGVDAPQSCPRLGSCCGRLVEEERQRCEATARAAEPRACAALQGELERAGLCPGDDGLCAVSVSMPQAVKNRADILFVLESSPGMGPVLAELSARFGQLIKVFQDHSAKGFYADLHLAVVDADLGSGLVAAPGCAAGAARPRGRLVARGAKAPPSCRAPLGVPFLRYAFAADGKATHNLPPGQDLPSTFTCMASLGDGGCGYQQPLEAAYQALRGADGSEFLRQDALLAVMFVGQRDDCSMPPFSDLGDPAKVARLGYPGPFRCARFGYRCGGAPPPYERSAAPLACAPAPNPDGAGPGRLLDLSRYVDLFTRPGPDGIKDNPNDVVLFGLLAPTEPVQVILADPGTPARQPYVECGRLAEESSPPCVPVLQRSCRNPAHPQLVGDPPLRLAAVISAAASHQSSSICEDNYTASLDRFGNLFVSAIGGGCAPFPITPDEASRCRVELRQDDLDGPLIARLPPCTSGGDPCWSLDLKDSCRAASPQGLGLTIRSRDELRGFAVLRCRTRCREVAP